MKILKIIPEDALSIRTRINQTIKLSKEGKTVRARVSAVSVLVFTFLSTLSYPVQGISRFGLELSHGQLRNAFIYLTVDLSSTVRCALLVFIEIPFVAFAILFPKKLSELDPLPILKTHAEALSDKLNAVANELAQKKSEIESLQKQLQKEIDQQKKIDAAAELLSKKLEELQKSLDQKEKEVELQKGQKKSEIEPLQMRIHRLEEEKSEIEKNLKSQLLQASLREKQNGLEPLNRSNENKEEDLLSQSYIQYKKEKPFLEQQIKNLQQTIFTLQEQNQNLEKQLKELQNVSGNAEKKVQTLDKRFTEISINGEPAWKNQKYRHILNLIIKASGIDLQKEIDTLQNENVPLAEKTRNALIVLNSPQYYPHTRAQHKAFIRELRKAILTDEYQKGMKKAIENQTFDPCISIIHKICMARYCKVPLYSFTETLIETIYPSGKESLKKELKNQKKAIRSLPSNLSESMSTKKGHDLTGYLDIDFDPQFYRNPPYLLSHEKYSNGQENIEMDCLRMPVPTYQPDQSEWVILNSLLKFITPTVVIPEYLAFLDACRLQNKKVLYFNYQNLIPKITVNGDESNRCSAFLNLQDNERYQNHFFVFTQPMDSPFIEAAFHNEEHVDADQFIKDFTKEMEKESKESSFSYPPEIGFNKWKENFSRIQKEIHQFLFQNKKKFNREERIAFVLISYIYFKKFIKLDLKADNFQSSCKDALDRAGLMMVLEYYVNMILLGRKDNPDDLKILKTMVDGAPFLVKKQGMIDSRRKILIAALKFLEKIEQDQLSEIKVGNFQLTDMKIAKESDLKIYPEPSTAMNSIEYLSALKSDEWIFPILEMKIEDFITKAKGTLTLERAKKQIEDDLHRSHFTVNKKTIGTSEELFKELETSSFESIPFLCHQGFIVDVLQKLKDQYDNPQLGYIVGQRPIPKNSREKNTFVEIDFNEQKASISLRTKLAIRDCNNGREIATIEGSVTIDLKKGTEVIGSWTRPQIVSDIAS